MPQFGGASEKCSVCSKTVYLNEKIVVEDKEDKKTFHKTCLKCSHCKNTLSLGNYASMNGVMYCKPHFKQLFATKGNYDEGFGKEKLTSKWSPNAAPASATGTSFVPVDKADDVAKPEQKKDTPSSIASKFQKTTFNSEKCEKCAKTVYVTEKIVIEEKDGKKTYHKACLRCTHCQVVLTLGNYAAMGGVTYCKPHFKQLFATKGNYDEGFGGEKHTTKWAPQASSAPASFVPVDKTDTKSAPAPSSTSETVANKFKNISASDKCDKCGKTVYLTEKIVVEDKDDKKLYHKSCLRCEHCQVVLSLGSYAAMNGVTYCKPHFKQLFAVKGNYDEGFGKEKHTAKWIEHNGEEHDHEHHDHHEHHDEPRHEDHSQGEPIHGEGRRQDHSAPMHGEGRRHDPEGEQRWGEEQERIRREEEEARRREEEERQHREEEEARRRDQEEEERRREEEEEERRQQEEDEERRRLEAELEQRREEEEEAPADE